MVGSSGKASWSGDFNGDGKADLLVYGTANAFGSIAVQVFLTQ